MCLRRRWDGQKDVATMLSRSPLVGWEDERFLDANGAIADFPTGDNSSASFKLKIKTADRTGSDSIKDVKIMVP